MNTYKLGEVSMGPSWGHCILLSGEMLPSLLLLPSHHMALRTFFFSVSVNVDGNINLFDVSPQIGRQDVSELRMNQRHQVTHRGSPFTLDIALLDSHNYT